ncbi:glycosyltransferase [Cerasicoccus frondis]|uniref:glycosyltransferase n=1 Tax=Cerasicoccus frondis TaxID=490090 RepID=UPI002852C432|nr:glycosyltransferase [Cerasicoccus frondis]
MPDTTSSESLLTCALKHLAKRSAFDRGRAALLRHFIRPGKRVVEWGCAEGDLLAALAPTEGMGIDCNPELVQSGQARYPSLQFSQAELLEPLDAPDKPFDYIVFDLLVGSLLDVQTALEKAQAWAHPRTRLVLTAKNSLYGGVNKAMSKRTGKPAPLNWLSRQDLDNLLELAGWETVQTRCELLCPFDIPLIEPLLNRWLVRLPLFKHLATTIILIARPKRPLDNAKSTTCSIILPARNESGNIANALQRIPQLGAKTELIFVEGNSKDDTWEEIQKQCAAYQGPLELSYHRQPGVGKWDAVRLGFEHATGDVLVIQDGDLTAPPEDLEKFFRAVVDGSAEFANGSRLVYPMEDQAMRYLNQVGNKAFAISLTRVLGQPVKDSLCGTKMMLRSDYEDLIALVRERLGDFDPFGDFNLLFGSAMLGLKIRDIPIRYRDRTYGDTNISRFRHGLVLLRMTWVGLRRIHFFAYSLRADR